MGGAVRAVKSIFSPPKPPPPPPMPAAPAMVAGAGTTARKTLRQKYSLRKISKSRGNMILHNFDNKFEFFI